MSKNKILYIIQNINNIDFKEKYCELYILYINNDYCKENFLLLKII